MYYGGLDDGPVLCLWRQVERSVIIAIFSTKKGGQSGALNNMIVHKFKSFCFSWTDLASGVKSCLKISILFHDLGIGSHEGS